MEDVVGRTSSSWSPGHDAALRQLLDVGGIGAAELELFRSTGALQVGGPLAPTHAVRGPRHLTVCVLGGWRPTSAAFPVPDEFAFSQLRPIQLRFHHVRQTEDGLVFALHRSRIAQVRRSGVQMARQHARFALWSARWLTPQQRAALKLLAL